MYNDIKHKFTGRSLKVKTFRSIICLVFVFALALTAVSCGNKPAGQTDDTTVAAVQTPGDTAEATTADPFAGINYGGATATVLAVSEQAKQFYVDPDVGETGDMLKDALYYRLINIQDMLNVKLEFIMENGNWNNREAFITKVENSVKDGGGLYDVIISYNLNPPVMATKGLLMNLYDAPRLDFSNPWYASDFVDTVSVGSNLFYAINNADYGSVRNMASIMFDKTLTSEHGYSDSELYSKVLDGSWTLEALYGYLEGTYKEMNGSNKPDYGDIFGLAVVDKARYDALFYGFGLQIVTKQGDGTMAMSLADEKNQTVLEAINRLLYENENVLAVDSSMYSMFKANQAYFYVTPIAIVDQKLTFDFGVLPVPKFNSDQTRYRTYISNTHEAWCIPVGSLTYDMGTDIIELFGSEAYSSISPVYFETMLKYRYSSDDKAAQVYDIIREGVIFDFGYMFGNSFSNNPFLLFRQKIQDNRNDWLKLYSGYSKVFDRELAAIVASLENPYAG